MKQLNLKIQLTRKHAWGGEGYHFCADVLDSGGQNFSLQKIQFDTHSGKTFELLENVAGREMYVWEFGDPSKVSNNYTTQDTFLFELNCQEAPELKTMTEEKLRYEREYIQESEKGIYWRIKSVKAL